MKENLSNPTGGSRANIEFFGRIMANVSHEFNNIITVISELAGLLKDLSLMARKGRPIPNDKIESLSDNISKQVARSKHLISHMNRFSHSVDDVRADVDPVQVVENMRVLTDRLFKNRQTCMAVDNPPEKFSLSTDPFELRRILFACLDLFLDASSPEVTVSIKQPENGSNPELRISGPVEAVSADFLDSLDAMKQQAQAIDGQLLYEQTETQILIRLVFFSNRD